MNRNWNKYLFRNLEEIFRYSLQLQHVCLSLAAISNSSLENSWRLGGRTWLGPSLGGKGRKVNRKVVSRTFISLGLSGIHHRSCPLLSCLEIKCNSRRIPGLNCELIALLLAQHIRAAIIRLAQQRVVNVRKGLEFFRRKWLLSRVGFSLGGFIELGSRNSTM